MDGRRGSPPRRWARAEPARTRMGRRDARRRPAGPDPPPPPRRRPRRGRWGAAPPDVDCGILVGAITHVSNFRSEPAPIKTLGVACPAFFVIIWPAGTHPNPGVWSAARARRPGPGRLGPPTWGRIRAGFWVSDFWALRCNLTQAGGC